jgi:hypothetical protein
MVFGGRIRFFIQAIRFNSGDKEESADQSRDDFNPSDGESGDYLAVSSLFHPGTSFLNPWGYNFMALPPCAMR